MSHTSVRTQIYFPKALKEEIERQSKWSGESMSEFIRKGMEKQVKAGKKKKESLKKLADDFRDFAKNNKDSGWTEAAIAQWQKERREDDDYMEARLQRAWDQVRRKKK